MNDLDIVKKTRFLLFKEYFLQVGNELLSPHRETDLTLLAEHLSDAAKVNNLIVRTTTDGGLSTREKARAVIGMLGAIPPAAQTRILSSHDILRVLLQNGQAGALVPFIDRLPIKEKVEILLDKSIFKFFGKGLWSEAVGFLKRLPEEAQRKILCADGVLEILKPEGEFSWSAREIVSLIKSMSPSSQTDILATEGSVSNLGIGQTKRVFDIIAALPREAQARVLSAQYNVGTLTCWLPGRRLFNKRQTFRLIAHLTTEEQGQVLAAGNAASGLIKYHKRGPDVVALIEKLGVDARKKVLLEGSAVESLAESGRASDVTRLVQNLDAGFRAEFLSSKSCITSMADAGANAGLLDLFKGLDTSQQTEVLSVNCDWISCWDTDIALLLIKNGQGSGFAEIVQKLPSEAQEKILARKKVEEAYATAGQKRLFCELKNGLPSVRAAQEAGRAATENLHTKPTPTAPAQKIDLDAKSQPKI